MEEVPSAGPGSEAAKQLEESDEEVDNGPDLAEVQRRMTNLKRQFNKTNKVVESKGRHSKEAKTEFTKLKLYSSSSNFHQKCSVAFFARSDLAEIPYMKKEEFSSYLLNPARVPRKILLLCTKIILPK